jgi:cob(I)alamin adenosyltransferase
MVKLNKIYTRTGDDGSTGLGDGSRVGKDDARVEAYGTVDEANAAIGLAVVAADEDNQEVIAGLLRSVQQDLFDVGADLCVPIDERERLRVTAGQSARLEAAIDEFNADLAPLTSFILPGGTRLAAHLHVARTQVRLAERRVVSLLGVDSARTNPEAVIYLNRLSDLLFVLARTANGRGAGDVLWVPGANRGS